MKSKKRKSILCGMLFKYLPLALPLAGCDGFVGDEPVSTASAITQAWQGESIEKKTSPNGGGAIGWSFRDGAEGSRICGSDKNPDWIVEGRLSGAYANRSRIRVYSINGNTSCAIANPSASRVYSDDTIRMCIGYNRNYACSMLQNNAPSGVRFWLE